MSLVRVDGMVRVPRALLSKQEIEHDWQALSCPNPARLAAERREDRRAYAIPERVSSLERGDEEVAYPIAAASVYKPRLRGKAYDLLDVRPHFEPQPLEYRGQLFDFQDRVVTALTGRPYGVAVAPCGAGKGEIACAVVGRLGLPSLIVVHTMDLAADLRERGAARLGVNVGLIGAGAFDVQRVTVALVQALDDDARLAELAPRFEVALLDEVHHAASPSYRRVLHGLRARRRYGFTATLLREDGLTSFVHHELGPVVAEVSRAELAQAGRSLTPTREVRATRWSYPYGGREDWAPMLAAMAASADRLDTIAASVAQEHGTGLLQAVIVGRIDVATAIAERLCARGLRAAVMTGGVPKRRRLAILDSARAGGLDVVVGTQLLDEGLDLPSLSIVHLAWPSRAEGRFVQRIGRTLRVVAGKPRSRVIDYIDDVGPLRWQAEQRARIFERVFGDLAEAA